MLFHSKIIISKNSAMTGSIFASRLMMDLIIITNFVLPLLEQYKFPATFFITAIRAAGYDILWNDFLGIVSKYGPEKIVYKNEPYYKGRFNKYISTESGLSLVEKLRSGGFGEKAEMMEVLHPMIPFKANKQDEDHWLQMTIEQIRQLSASPFCQCRLTWLLS